VNAIQMVRSGTVPAEAAGGGKVIYHFDGMSFLLRAPQPPQ
jgi:hypothetical protein